MSESTTTNAEATATAAQITGVVVHWNNEDELEQLLHTWPRDDARFPLIVVDNSGTAGHLRPAHPRATWLTPKINSGFGGGCNLAVKECSSRWFLLLNPDTRLLPGALGGLAAAAEDFRRLDQSVAMVAPRLVDERGSANQFGWQLRPLTQPRDLLAQCLFLSRPKGPEQEPDTGSLVEQPAAAALLIWRDAFDQIDGFDERFQPAWFEDVDLAHRMSEAGFTGRYLSEVSIMHAGGASVPSLGFGRFLVSYYRNLERFAVARGWRLVAAISKPLVAVASLLRIPLLLVQKPKRARSRMEAARAFLVLAGAAVSGWRFGAPTS